MGKDSDREPSLAVPLPDFGQVDPSILGLANPQLANNPSAGVDNLYPSQWSNKTWGQQMIFHTGGAYLIGSFAGGAYGMYEGLKKAKDLNNRTLKMNAIINKVSKHGSGFGNAFGILAIMYTSYDSLLSSYSYRPETWHHVAAAGLAGFTYKSTAGLRAGVVAGILGAGASGVIALLRSNGKTLRQYLPLSQM